MGYDDLNPDYLPTKPVSEKKERGCFFYGCITLIIVTVLGIVVVGAGAYWLYRKVINTAVEYTETKAEPMPPVTMPEAQRKALHERVNSFNEALNKRTATEPLVLTAEEINALIDDEPKLKGKAHVEIKDDKVLARISFPLGDLTDMAELKDRYLNGSATLLLDVDDGQGEIRMENVEVKGKPLPEPVAKALTEKNIIEGSFGKNNSDNNLDEIQSLVVKDGKVIITPKPPKTADEPKADEPKTEEPKADEPKPDDTPLPDPTVPEPNKTDDPGTPAPEDVPKAA